MNRRTSLACVIVTAIAAPASAFTALSGAVANDPSQIALGVATISVLGGLWSIPRVEASGSAELEPVPELVPQWLWRANLDAALEEMTLQKPTIDYDRVNSWTPYAESAPGRSRGPVPRKEELIRKSFSGATFLQVAPPLSAGLKAQSDAFEQGVQAGSALERGDDEIVWDYDNPVSYDYDPVMMTDRAMIYGLKADGTEVYKSVRVVEPREITTWGSATPLRTYQHLMF